MIRKKELLFFGILLLLCLVFAGVRYHLSRTSTGYDRIRITVSGEILGVYDLSEDQTITIGSTNVCTIKDGCASMTEADCPDHLCMKMSAVGSGGGQIICLPNRVVIEGVKGENADSDSDLPDAITY